MFTHLLLFTILLLGVPAFAQEADRTITPQNAPALTLLAETPVSDGDGESRVAWTPEGELLISVTTSDGQSSTGIQQLDDDLLPDLSHVLAPSRAGALLDVAVSPDGETIAYATMDALTFYDAQTAEPAQQLDVAAAELAYSPDGSLLAYYTPDSGVHLLDTATASTEEIVSFEGAGVPDGIAFSPDGGTLAISDYYHRLYLWDIAAQEGRWLAPSTLQGGGGGSGFPVTPRELAAFSPNGGLLVTGAASALYLWDVEQEQLLAEFQPNPAAFTTFSGATFNTSGTLLATAAADDTFEGVYLWNTTTLRSANGALGNWGVPTITEPIARLQHTELDSIAFNPDGTLLASIGGGIARLWGLDAPTQAELQARNDVNLVAYCDQLDGAQQRVSSSQSPGIVWSWFAVTPEQLYDHLGAAIYEVSLDTAPLGQWRYLSQPQRDDANNFYWTVYYYLSYPTNLRPGEHVIDYRVSWSQPISDGLQEFGPGTDAPEQTGTCTFTVS